MKTIFKQGHMAKVYIENNHAYKIYDDFYPEEWVDKEIYIHDILRANTSLNVTELIKTTPHEIRMLYLGKDSLDHHLINQFEDSKLVDFVHLQSEIHSYRALELENAHVVYKRWLEMSQLGSSVKEIAMDVLNKIEYKNNLCHFDFQPSHVVYYQNQYYTIDWIHAKLANPILDIAKTYVSLRLDSYDVAQKYIYKTNDMTDILMDNIYKVIPLMAAIKMIETDDIYELKVLTTLVFDPRNKDVTK